MRGWIIATVLACVIGCASAEEKCEEAQDAARASWGAYAAELDETLKTAKTEATKLALRMRDDVEPRMGKRAEAAADARHDRSTAEWHRAYDAHIKAVCTTDADCKQLKMDQRTNTMRVEETKVLVAKTVKVTTLIGSNIDRACDVGKAIEEFERDSIREARELTIAARDTCADVD